MSAGCRIRRNFERPAKELVEAFRGIPVANIDDNCGRIAAVDASIFPLNPKARLLGTAFTVNAPAGDNLLFHAALDMAQPGDVIVLANKGSMSRALCGEIMSNYAKKRGLAGILIDGCVRDSYTLSQMDLPVYAKGITPNGPYKNGPGEMNFPVSFGKRARIFSGHPQQRSQAGRAHPKGNGFYHPRRTLDVSLERNT